MVVATRTTATTVASSKSATSMTVMAALREPRWRIQLGIGICLIVNAAIMIQKTSLAIPTTTTSIGEVNSAFVANMLSSSSTPTVTTVTPATTTTTSTIATESTTGRSISVASQVSQDMNNKKDASQAQSFAANNDNNRVTLTKAETVKDSKKKVTPITSKLDQNDQGRIQSTDDKKKKVDDGDDDDQDTADAVLTSPACQPTWGDDGGRSIQRIYFAHTRKAGGSFLKRLLQHVAKRFHWTFDSREAMAVESPKRNDTLYVTNLRHPVERSISHYKFEGRWNCPRLIYDKNYVPTMEDSKTLQEFIDNPNSILPHRTLRFDPCLGRSKDNEAILWKCAQNCYLRWFGLDFNCLRNVTNNYETALQNLLQFHLIVTTERLRDPQYVAGLMQMFGLPPNMEFSSKMYCDKQSKYWNAKLPANFRNETVEQLRQGNQLDTKLYKRVTDCPNGVVFPVKPDWLGRKPPKMRAVTT